MCNVNDNVASPVSVLQLEGRENRNVIYLTADIPIEIITATGGIPYCIPSDLESMQELENTASVLQSYICS